MVDLMHQLTQCMQVFRRRLTMLKKIMKPILFLFILAVILKLLSFLFVPKNNFAEFGMQQIEANGILGEKNNTIDVLIIGDSESFSSFSPLQMYEEQGFTSYVCGTPAQRLFDSYAFFEKALETQTPKIVMLETNAIFRKYSITKDIESKLKKIFPIFQDHNRWKNLTINDFFGEISYTYTDPMKGYHLNHNTKPVPNRNYMAKNKKFAKIPANNLKYVEMMRKKSEEKGIKFILVSSASIKNWNFSKHQSIKKYAMENNVPYYDLNINHAVRIDWNQDTSDKGDHLNYNGAKKISTYMANLLKTNYELPDHRNDKLYRKWNQDLVRYKKLVK